MAKQLNSYEVKLDFKADTSQAKKEIQSLQDQLSNAIRIGGSQSNFGGAITKDLGKALSTAAQLKEQLQQAINVDTGRLDLGKFYDSMKKAGLSLNDYQRDLMKLGPEGEKSFDQLANSIANAELPLKRSNALLTEFWTTLKNTARWQISSSLLHGFMGSISAAYGYAQDLNESLNNIRIVTGYNVDKMSDFAAAANKAAQALSTTTTSYTDAALIYYQQGLSDEEVLGRTDVTIKLANVARESAETVSDQMTAVWNNFYDGSKSLEYYADVMTALGAATASSTSEISQGLEKFAAVADTVGLSYEYATAALATVTATTRQSADIVGTAFKTLFARLEQLKLGETLDDGTTLGQYSQALEKVGVNIKDSAGNLKDMDNILDELAAKWQTLAKDQQVALAQQVAGVRQYTQLIALMDNWDFMESNLEVARGAEGTLEKQADIYAESWEAAKKRVKAAAEDIYGALLDDEFFIDLNNIFADALKSLKSLIEGMGGLKGVLFSLGAIITTVFQKQLNGSLNNALYSMRMMTAAGQKEYRDFQVESVQRTLVAAQGEGATKNAYNESVAKAYVEHANLYNRFREISAHLSEDQVKILKPLLEENEALRENVKLRAEAAQKANQQANAQKNSFFNQNQKAIKDLGIENELNDILEKAKSTGVGEGSEGPLAKFYNQSWSKKNYSTAELKGRYQDLYNSLFPGGNNDMLNALGIDPSRIKEYKTKIQNGIKGNFQGNGMQQFVDEIYEATVDTSSRSYLKDISDLFDEAGKKAGFSSAKIKKLKEAFQEVAKTSSEAATKTQEMSNATEDLNHSTENTDHALRESFNANLQLSDSIVAVVGAITSLASVINMVQGLGSLWTNEDISIGQKLVTTITTLGMAYGILAKQVTQENVVKLAHVGALTLEKIGLDKSAVASMEDAVAKNAEAGAITLATGALSKYILTLGAAVAAIAAVIFVIYQLVQAHDKEVHKVENAKNAANELQKSYEKLREEVNQFKESISEYQEGLKALDKLKDKQDEFNETLDKSNKKAKELIETYGLWDSYSYDNNGAIVIDEEKLNEVIDQKNRQVSNAEYNTLKSKAYANTLENTEAVDKNAKKLAEAYQKQYEKTTQSATSTEQFTTTVQRLNEEYTNFLNEGESLDSDLGAFQQYLLTHTGLLDNINGVLNDDIFTALQDYHESLVQVSESNKYFAEQILHNAIIEKYGEDIEKLATVNGVVDQGLYDSFVNLIASGNKDAFQMALEGTEDLTNRVTSVGQIQNIISQNEEAAKRVFSRIGIDDISNIAQYNAPQIYGALREGGNYNDYRTKSYAGFQSRKVYDKTGSDVLYDVPLDEMLEEIAKQIIMEATLSNTEELNNSTLKAYEDAFNQVTQNLQEKGLDLDIGGILRAAFTNGGLENWSNELDITPILNTLNQSAIEGLKNLTDSQLGELFGAAEEKAEEAGSRYREQLGNWSKDAYWSHFNEEGEAAAKQLELDVDVFKAYRETLKETKEEVEDNAELLNKLAISEKRLERGCKSLIDSWEDYNEVISKIKNTNESLWDQNADFSEIVPDIQKALANIADVDVSQIEKLGTKFIVENWDLITQSINGADGALDELQAKLSGLNLKNHLIEIGLDDTQAVNEIMNLHDYITNVNNLEIDVPINSGPFLDACNDMILAAQMTKDQASDYFSELGFDTEFTTNPQPVSEWVPNYESMYSVRPTDNGFVVEKNNSNVTWERVDGTIEVPALKSITPNKAYGGNIKKLGGRGGGGKKSGGGGKSSAPAESQKVTSKADAGVKRYKEIDDAIEDLTKDQERLNKVTDAYYGANKVAYMKQQHKLLQKEIDLHKERFKWAQKYYDEDKAELDKYAKETLGVEIEYDEDGSIKNYTPIMEGLYSQLNEKEKYWADASHFSSKEEQDEYKKANIDPIADAMNDFQKRVDTFDESNEERKEEMNKGIELMIEFKQQEYEIWQEGWKNQQDILEDQIKFLDHAKKMLGDSAADMGEALALTVGGDNNYVQNALDQLDLYKNKEQELNDLLAANKITQADYVKGMEEIRDGYLEQTENLKALDDEMMEYYGKILDKVISEIKEYTDAMDKLNSQLDRYMKVMKLTGRELDYDAIGDILEAQQKVLNDQYTTDVNTLQMLREREQHWLDELARQTTDEGRELIERQLKETREQLVETENQVLDDLAAQAEKAAEILENARAKSMAVYENMLTDGLGFDYVDGLLERQSTLQEEYLTKTNQVFETTKMLRKLQSDMDATNNRAAKQRLSNFSKEIEDLKNRESMTKADLELAQKRYDLLLAEIALEEAQKAKTTVRLQRDNEGNYGYVYTADEGDIAKAQDDLYNAENDLYNTRLRITNEYGEKIIQLNQEQADALNELWDAYYNKHSISEDEYEQKRAEIVNHYNELRKTYVHNYVEAQKQDARVVADAWINQDTNMIKSSETWQRTTDKLIAQTENAIRRYENTSSWLEGQQEIHFGNVEEETQKVTTASNELKDKVNEEVIPAYDDLWNKVDAVYQKYSAERREIQLNIIEYDKLAKQLQVTIDKYRLLADASDIKTFNSDGDVKDTDTEVKDVSSGQTVTANGGTGGKDKTYTSDTPSGSTVLSQSEVGKYITEYAKNYSSDVYDKTNVKLDLINGIYYSKEDVKNAVANWMAKHKKQSVVTAAAEAVKKVNGSASQDVGGNNFSRKTAAKMSRASGGYTGEWSDGSGKLAILHSNEIVLNSHDTDNMFGIIDMVREITKTIDVNAAGVIGGYGALSSGSMNAGPQTLEQNVQITASFPNATDHNEIEEAFNNLINKASQYANRTR